MAGSESVPATEIDTVFGHVPLGHAWVKMLPPTHKKHQDQLNRWFAQRSRYAHESSHSVAGMISTWDRNFPFAESIVVHDDRSGR